MHGIEAHRDIKHSAFPVKTAVENLYKSHTQKPKAKKKITQQHVMSKELGSKTDFITSEFSLPESLNESQRYG